MLLSIKQYAEQHGLDPSSVRRKILRGKLEAVKVGSQWVIDSETPYIDHRADGRSNRWKKELAKN